MNSRSPNHPSMVPLTMILEVSADESLVVSARAWAQNHDQKFSAVITLEDPEQPVHDRVRFEGFPSPVHLVLTFVDLDKPPPQAYAGLAKYRMAERADIESALAFSRMANRDRLLVHCNAGVGRSTAVALAILADRFGSGRERQALDELLRLRPQAVPNLHVLALADEVLSRAGELVRVVQIWEEAKPEKAQHRLYNRLAHFVFDGIDLEPGE